VVFREGTETPGGKRRTAGAGVESTGQGIAVQGLRPETEVEEEEPKLVDGVFQGHEPAPLH